MSTFILVLDADKELRFWAARNSKSDLNELKSHPFYSPTNIHKLPKRTNDQDCGSVMAIASTGGTTPATIIRLDESPFTLASISGLMDSHFAAVKGPTKKATKKALPKKKAVSAVDKKVIKKTVKKK